MYVYIHTHTYRYSRPVNNRRVGGCQKKKHIPTDKGAAAPTMSPLHSTEHSLSCKRSVKYHKIATFGNGIWNEKMFGISKDKWPRTDKPPPQIVFFYR